MVKRIGHLVVILAIVVWPAICHALPNENGEYPKLGVGNLECGLWTQARQSGDVYAVWWKTLILGWVQGFLTAYNRYSPESFDLTKGTDADSVARWVDAYCIQHPIENIADAAEALVEDFHKPERDNLPSSLAAPR